MASGSGSRREIAPDPARSDFFLLCASESMIVGILTGGGDCPGLNPVIRGAVRIITNAGGRVLGLLEGWRGAIEGHCIELTAENTDGIIDKGGTILGSSRTNPYKKAETVDTLVETFRRL